MKVTKTFTIDLDVFELWCQKIGTGDRSKTIEGYMREEIKS